VAGLVQAIQSGLVTVLGSYIVARALPRRDAKLPGTVINGSRFQRYFYFWSFTGPAGGRSRTK
jgi:hypothetical protein